MRKMPKVGAVDAALLALALVTAVLWLRDQLPASKAELAEIVALSAPNAAAREAVVAALSEDTAPNKRDARHLRERVVTIERASIRLSEDKTAREMMDERERLAAIPFAQMAFDDATRWMLFCLGRYVPLVVGMFAGLCGLMLFRVREWRQRARS